VNISQHLIAIIFANITSYFVLNSDILF